LVRQLALLALFELDVTQHNFDEVITRVIDSPFLDDADSEGAPPSGQAQPGITIPEEALRDKAELTRQVRDLVMGVIANVERLDSLLQEAAPALPVSQIAVVDRNVLRIGLYQLLYDESVPDFAAINEAVELAKRFGGERSAAFVNGVLRAVQQARRAQEPTPPTAPAPPDQSAGNPDTGRG
jgi:transcription antitermination factor NusB